MLTLFVNTSLYTSEIKIATTKLNWRLLCCDEDLTHGNRAN